MRSKGKTSLQWCCVTTWKLRKATSTVHMTYTGAQCKAWAAAPLRPGSSKHKKKPLLCSKQILSFSSLRTAPVVGRPCQALGFSTGNLRKELLLLLPHEILWKGEASQEQNLSCLPTPLKLTNEQTDLVFLNACRKRFVIRAIMVFMGGYASELYLGWMQWLPGGCLATSQWQCADMWMVLIYSSKFLQESE